LLVERTENVLTFTLDNAEQGNEVTGKMLDVMQAELEREAQRPRARVLRIRARGKVFCSGRERAGQDAQSIRKEAARLIGTKRLLRESPLVSVAEVQGDALGFGFGLAIVCDFVLVAQRAALGFPEMRFGLAPSAIMAYLLDYALPRCAFPLVLFGDTIDAQQALEMGLISQVCTLENLANEADRLITRILLLDSNAVRRCKQFFMAAQQNSFEQNCRLAAEALTVDSLARLAREE
jgi:enoyl-CoA hydratase/carnithine racemase